jgi:hypothetical protein
MSFIIMTIYQLTILLSNLVLFCIVSSLYKMTETLGTFSISVTYIETPLSIFYFQGTGSDERNWNILTKMDNSDLNKRLYWYLNFEGSPLMSYRLLHFSRDPPCFQWFIGWTRDSYWLIILFPIESSNFEQAHWRAVENCERFCVAYGII